VITVLSVVSRYTKNEKEACMRGALVVLALCVLVPAPVMADLSTVNIDFQPPSGATTYSGLGMAPDSGTFWNAMSLGSKSNLTASDGTTVTDIDVSTNYTFYYQDGGNTLLRDRIIWSDGTPHTGNPSEPAITISGLDASLLYDVYLYAGHYAQTFTINGVSKSLTAAHYDWNQPNWIEGVHYVYFPGISPTGGAININIFNTAPTDTVISGMQIQAVVPVPPAILLGMLGLGAAGVRMRRFA
jgi:hypothetical protein